MYGADIFVMPCVVHSSSDRDGIPNVIMEALVAPSAGGGFGCRRDQ